MSLEELLEMEITSVSKHAQKLEDAAAAVFVINQEDIRRSGATTVADLLRMVPGLHVARLNANGNVVTARGFSDLYANKLLVLMDGRTLYSPIFSGVFWSDVDPVLEDIERIEVIRGPGASLWGANAVNGIINIITKKASDTTGVLASTVLGTEDREIVTLRYGDGLGTSGAYRVYLKARERDPSVTEQGDDAVDDWRAVQGGFRLDWNPSQSDTVTLQGDVQRRRGSVFERSLGLSPPAYTCHLCHVSDFEQKGVNLLGRWNRQDPAGNSLQVQAYYDYTGSTGSQFLEWRAQVFDLEYQQDHTWGERQLLTWGAGARLYTTDTSGGSNYYFSPEGNDWYVLNAFVQDEITLVPEKLFLTLGSKLEYHEDVGLAIQPTARILWKYAPRHTLWAAASRAVRTPSLGEQKAHITMVTRTSDPSPADLVFFNLSREKELDPEEVLAFEVGYRAQIGDRLSVDVAGFYNRYDKLIAALSPTGATVSMDPLPHLETTSLLKNAMTGEVYGLEIGADWKVTDRWKLRGAYTLTRMFLHNQEETPLLVWGEDLEGKTPRHQVSLRSQWDLPGNVELDGWLRYVSRLPELDIPSYVTGDIRLSWSPRKNLEVSLVGRNLLDPEHPEFAEMAILPSESNQVERSLYGKITWRF
ncbi:TonB-dependent receptor plug domain-containing protein [Desulfacinum hydrothermale]|uniref:TonB-dependent receptor plug domain-containing protein n=1 Tax=Desulfacinum hydrothermale TaxID=109258 RepID=UPI001BB01E10|nr:TonB-dependent receptor [Desulfacinum hydrothermale]